MELKVDGVIYQHQPFGGISRVFTEILPLMCEIDSALQITLFTSGRCRQDIPIHPGIKHQALLPIDDFLRPSRLWRPIQQPARRLLQRTAVGSSKWAVWHSTYYTLPILWDGPIVTTVYDMIHERYPDLFASSYHKRLMREKRSSVLAADKVICISDTTGDNVQNYYGIDDVKIQVIPLACNQDFQRLDSGDCSQYQLSERPFLLYVGKRDRHKNFEMLLQAFSNWQRRNEVDLLVVGSEWSEEERRWLKVRGIQEQVRLLTAVDDRTLACLYNQAQAFVFPSLFEGFGIPLLEAMACGCPLVASHIPSTWEVAGDIPYYFEPTDLDDLLAALDAALSEGRNPTRIESGIKRTQQYSWDKTARKTLQVYRSLINT